MNYLLLTYVPIFAGQSPGVLRFLRTHWDDLCAQTTALADVGFAVTLATPHFATIDARTLARETFVDVPAKDRLFKYLPLPAYRTMRKFISVRSRVLEIISAAARDADVVQLGAGGHPIALGQAAWEEAVGRKRVFVFAGDPFPALQAAVNSGRNPAKRIGKKIQLRRFEEFASRAVREADLVFSHSPDIADRFNNEWNPRCHTFAAPALRDSFLSVTPRRSTAGRALRLLAVGDSLATAGLDHLIAAVAQARRLSADVELALLGNVAESEALTHLLRQEDLEPVVHLLGTPQNAAALANAMDHADVLLAGGLIPRPFETIFSAAARGLPMLGYAGQSPGDALSDAGGAVVIPRGEQRLFAQSLLDLSRNRDQIVRLSAAARAWAASRTLDAVHRERAMLVTRLGEK